MQSLIQTMKIFYHADDFGVTVNQSNTILNCRRNGLLNSVSIIPNSPHVKESYELIAGDVSSGALRCVCHLNFVEGLPLAPISMVKGLINPSSCLFKNSFAKMLRINLSPLRFRYKAYYKAEIRAQLKAVSDLTKSRTLSIDSHQHYHMIPFIFEALMEVITEDHYKVGYLRIPVDPIKPLISCPRLWPKVPPVNIAKWGLLKLLYMRDRAILARYAGAATFKDMNTAVFFGMFFTCRMERDVVSRLLPAYRRIASSHGRDLELMLHPGGIYDKNELLDPSNKDLIAFYSSPFRYSEQKTLLSKSKL